MPTRVAVQEKLNQMWVDGNVVEPMPITAMLNSELNKAPLVGEMQTLVDGNGKVNSIQANYQQQVAAAAAAADGDMDCTQVAPTASSTVTYTPTWNYFTDGFQYNPTAYSTDTDGGVQYFAEQLRRAITKVTKGAEKFITTDFINNIGTFAPTVASRSTITANVKEIATWADAAGLYWSKQLLSTLKTDAMGNLYRNAPTIIGHGLIANAMEGLGYNAGLDQYGFNPEKAMAHYGYNFIDTLYADAWGTVATAEKFITYDMGAVQLVNIPKFRGDAEFMSEDKKSYTVQDPVSGLMVDVKENITCLDSGGFVNNVSAQVAVDTFSLPADLYDPDATYGAAGVLGVNGYLVKNPV